MAVAHLHILVSALTVALCPTGIAASPVMCAGGNYKPGEAATITCYFNGNFQEGQTTSVYITRNDFHAQNDSPGKKVLDCDVKGDSFSSCRPDENFRFIGFTKSVNLTVEIPDVSAEFQGRYTCGVVPSEGLSVKPCYLLVQGASGQGANDHKHTAEKDEELHGRQKTIIALLVIIILVAVIAVLIFAYKKNWFPCGKRAQKQSIDEEKAEMLPESDRSGTMAVAYKPTKEESARSPIYTGNKSAPSSEPLPTHKQPLIQGPQHSSDTTGIEGRADEKKVETKEERKARLEQEDRLRKEELRKRLENATKEEKKRIQREFDENEKRVRRQRKEEEEHWKKQIKDEEARMKREKKEQADRLKQQKKEEEESLKGEKRDQENAPK